MYQIWTNISWNYIYFSACVESNFVQPKNVLKHICYSESVNYVCYFGFIMHNLSAPFKR